MTATASLCLPCTMLLCVGLNLRALPVQIRPHESSHSVVAGVYRNDAPDGEGRSATPSSPTQTGPTRSRPGLGAGSKSVAIGRLERPCPRTVQHREGDGCKEEAHRAFKTGAAGSDSPGTAAGGHVAMLLLSLRVPQSVLPDRQEEADWEGVAWEAPGPARHRPKPAPLIPGAKVTA